MSPAPPAPSDSPVSPDSPTPVTLPIPSPPAPRPRRTITRPAYLHDYVCPTLHAEPTASTPASPASGTTAARQSDAYGGDNRVVSTLDALTT
ncbi:hypothetical protein F0562_005192 [Nyssa sinensis]|uniref:Uncharacterized protein n=1 Tax=Nyssa sinensis TaxID=561372 RepID=A0A5J5AHH8_9ASTE|nr:hypothetical protein F0562_005192 [Nyssa sinensis]